LGTVPGSQPLPAALAHNGSFVALRKLHEDVAGFRRYLADNAARLADGNPELLAAKMMGRWRSGAPLALAPTADNPALAEDMARNNAFDYQNDPKGFACPFGAHVCRVNPRDNTVHHTRRHRLMRRGLPYGPPLPPGLLEDDGPPLPPDPLEDDGADRGVLLLMICADLERQFEFIQQVWINQGIFMGLGRERDPIAGNHDNTLGMTINRFPIARRAPALPRFITTRGAGYFFLPGLAALRLLASGRATPPRPPAAK
jgi:Dyp-type peroxidase family